MDKGVGYLYIRNNKICELYGACKFGKVGNGENPINRFQTYTTYEIEPGNIILLIETIENVNILENELKKIFTMEGFHIYHGGGTEYFRKEIIDQIIPILEMNNLNFRICSQLEIEQMVPKKQEISNLENPGVFSLIKNVITAKEHQIDVLEKSRIHYLENDIGRLNWSCGLGKSLMSLFIVRNLNFKTVVIGVPNKNLQKQFRNEILRVFPKKENIMFIGSIKENNVLISTEIGEIKGFIDKPRDQCCFLITTYHSCNILLELEEVDFKIGDEAHHLTGKVRESDKNFKLFHSIKSRKTLFMTATEKIIDIDGVYSMNDEDVFGKLIDSKSVNWAIENRKITDLILVIIKNKEEEFREIIDKLNISNINIELFISAFMTLKAIEKYNNLTHILIYVNTAINAETVMKYIDTLLKSEYIDISIDDIYNNALYSDKSIDITSEIEKFKSKKYGIISCVYLFGEGFNEPKLNGVTFADKMESDIRITQFALRPNRLEKGNENKIAYNIIPYIEPSSNSSFEKCRTIISKLRNSIDSIESKISLLSCSSTKKYKKKEAKDSLEIEISDNNEELQKIKIRLKYTKALESSLSEEQDEFNYVQQLNKNLNIQSKGEYSKSKEIHDNFIEDPEDYFRSKGVWTNWINFLGIDTSKFLKTKDEWKIFCKNINISDWEEYINACSYYDELPKNPEDFYQDFTNFMNELSLFPRRR